MDKLFLLKEDQKSTLLTELNYGHRNILNILEKSKTNKKMEYSKKVLQNYRKTLLSRDIREKHLMRHKDKNLLFPSIKEIKRKGTSYKKENYIEKEKLISQILQLKAEINSRDNDIKEYKDYYDHLLQNNLTFKIIIERLLNIKTNDDGENISKNIKTNKLEQNKLDKLKLQIVNYDKNIVKQEDALVKIKEDKKINNFLNINNLLAEKNKELENLIETSQKLQKTKGEIDSNISFYFNSIKNLGESIKKMEDKIRISDKEIEQNEKEINQIINVTDEYYNQIAKLEENLNKIEDNKNIQKEKKDKILHEYNNYKELLNEKNIIDNELNDITNKLKNIKKVINKNNITINRIVKENKDLENDINIMKVENEKMKKKFEKGKNLKKSTQISKKTNWDVKSNKTYEKNKNNFDLISKKDNESVHKEIQELEENKIGLIEKLNLLKDELEQKTKINKDIEEELNKVNLEYNFVKDN